MKIAALTWTFATVGHLDAQLFQQLAKAAERSLGDYSQPVSNAAHARQLENVNEGNSDVQIFVALKKVAEWHVHDFNTQELAKAASSCCRSTSSDSACACMSSGGVADAAASLPDSTNGRLDAAGFTEEHTGNSGSNSNDDGYGSDTSKEDIDHLEEASRQRSLEASRSYLDVRSEGDIEDLVEASVSEKASVNGEPRDMVTAPLRKALTGEGYKIIGTHSGIKLCLWAKNQLRGRGGCYKHTFYGITSYQCMNASPNLACANKCVFCWRHHTNPVSKEWRWKTDDPSIIVKESIMQHVNMIKGLANNGMKGVQPDRLQAAQTVRHCALSLVGEPITYPRINEMVGELHSRNISTFLVTNGQFPDAVRDLRPITQLYLSVDAPTAGSLKIIDRPLFSDSWERLQQSMRYLKAKQQRTTARLTLVKGFNMGDLDGYANLMALGHPTLIEVKGMTICGGEGKNPANPLTKEDNMPSNAEVMNFSLALVQRLSEMKEAGADLPPYGVACAHAHSRCVLLARMDVLRGKDGTWRTWIDFDAFHRFERRWTQTGEKFRFTDYIEDTPSWALVGAEEAGIDPNEEWTIASLKKKDRSEVEAFKERELSNLQAQLATFKVHSA